MTEAGTRSGAPVPQSRVSPSAADPTTRRTPIVSRPAPVRGVVFIRKARCKGCELCIEFCPTGVLTRSREFNVKGYHYPVAASSGCIHCRLCLTVCPEYAIFSVAAPVLATRPGNGGGA
jgi:2-oxoglutarate ferredoxin oxidoreductase subunit delta